ncbi:MAG: helix-turn-helix domain-containing protein [Bacteroidota bacterium]
MEVSKQVKQIRTKLGYTQAALAEKANLSIRTIQRIESGKSIPKGYTLNALSVALEVEKEELLATSDQADANDFKLKVKLINLSALALLIFPFGNLIFPIVLWKKYSTTHPVVDEVGRRIVNFQLTWSLITYLILIMSPFLGLPTLLFFGILAIFNIVAISRAAHAFQQSNYEVLSHAIKFL